MIQTKLLEASVRLNNGKRGQIVEVYEHRNYAVLSYTVLLEDGSILPAIHEDIAQVSIKGVPLPEAPPVPVQPVQPAGKGK